MNISQQQPPKKNESWEHFLMKNVADTLLRLHFGCTIAAMEVAGLGNYENRHKDWEGFKYIADAVGIKECKRWVLTFCKRMFAAVDRLNIINHGGGQREHLARDRALCGVAFSFSTSAWERLCGSKTEVQSVRSS